MARDLPGLAAAGVDAVDLRALVVGAIGQEGDPRTVV
jgi:hypothetical protein